MPVAVSVAEVLPAIVDVTDWFGTEDGSESTAAPAASPPVEVVDPLVTAAPEVTAEAVPAAVCSTRRFVDVCARSS